MNYPKRTARVAGVLYLIIVAAGLQFALDATRPYMCYVPLLMYVPSVSF